MRRDEDEQADRRDAPEPIVLPLPVPEPAEPVPA
jgi:hypothetical protein